MKPLIALTLFAFAAAAGAQTPAAAPPAAAAVMPPPVVTPVAKPARVHAAKAPAAPNPNLVEAKTACKK